MELQYIVLAAALSIDWHLLLRVSDKGHRTLNQTSIINLDCSGSPGFQIEMFLCPTWKCYRLKPVMESMCYHRITAFPFCIWLCACMCILYGSTQQLIVSKKTFREGNETWPVGNIFCCPLGPSLSLWLLGWQLEDQGVPVSAQIWPKQYQLQIPFMWQITSLMLGLWHCEWLDHCVLDKATSPLCCTEQFLPAGIGPDSMLAGQCRPSYWCCMLTLK